MIDNGLKLAYKDKEINLCSFLACLGIGDFISCWPAGGGDVRPSAIGKIDCGGELQEAEVEIVRDGVVVRMFTLAGIDEEQKSV